MSAGPVMNRDEFPEDGEIEEKEAPILDISGHLHTVEVVAFWHFRSQLSVNGKWEKTEEELTQLMHAVITDYQEMDEAERQRFATVADRIDDIVRYYCADEHSVYEQWKEFRNLVVIRATHVYAFSDRE